MREKIILIIVLSMSILGIDIQAQFKINSVGFYGNYTTALTNKNELKVNSTKGPGGELEVRFDMYKNLKLSINTGYQKQPYTKRYRRQPRGNGQKVKSKNHAVRLYW
jgi:hypothetical protein